MVLAVLSVILHSFDGIKTLHLNGPLAGVLLISPWISFNVEGPSWTENADKDSIPAEAAVILSAAYADPPDHNNFSEPIRADVSWWRNLPTKAILNVFGGYECFRDELVDFGARLVKAGNEVKNVECPLQVHIDCILDAQGGTDVDTMSTEVWKWLSSVM